MKTLLIDDVRDPGYVNAKWNVKVTDVARTFSEGINALKQGNVGTLLLDHDLASFDGEDNELTGCSIMLFLEENPEYLPRRIILVTSNPVGRDKMQVVMNKLYQK